MCNKKTITLNGIEYVEASSLQKVNEQNLPAVLIRSDRAGVHFGFLKSKDYTPSGVVVVLENTRRVWYWDGAASLSQMAAEGVAKPDNCKFSMANESNEIAGVIEILPLTEKAFNNLSKVTIWKS